MDQTTCGSCRPPGRRAEVLLPGQREGAGLGAYMSFPRGPNGLRQADVSSERVIRAQRTERCLARVSDQPGVEGRDGGSPNRP